MSVGGTSGNPSTSGNLLSVNLGGLDLNYDLGPSTSTVASQAYSFLNNSFSNDSALLTGAISGANNLVSSVSNPVIAMAQQQQTFNTEELPDMFTELNTQNFVLGGQAINEEGSVANASIAASNATAREASSGGGGCYITTAVCETLGLPDDCHTLEVLRRFRDSYMLATNVRRAFVIEYYRTAPLLVAAMRAREDASEFIASLYERFILPALIAIEGNELDRAFRIYRQMTYYVKDACHG